MQRYRHDPSKNLVGFVVGDVAYAVPIAKVREIANPLGLVPLPHAPRSVVGVADYRGEVVAVVDLRLRFGLSATPTTRKTKWIVVDVADGSVPHGGLGRPAEPGQAPGTGTTGGLVALVVDAVTDVFGTANSELRPAPALGGGDDMRGIAGVVAHGSTMVFVLDTARLRDLSDIVVRARLGEAPAGALVLPPGTVP